MRVSGGHLCAKHRSTDRGGGRDLEPIIAQTSFAWPLAVPKSCYPLGARATFDRGASLRSLYPPPAAVATLLGEQRSSVS